MSIEKNQNPDQQHQQNPEFQVRLEHQQTLIAQVQQLRSLEQQVLAQQAEQKQVSESLEAQLQKLETKIARLDLKNQENFDVQFAKINAQLEILKATREATTTLLQTVKNPTNPQRVQQIQSDLSEHHPQANQERAKSYENILNIAPQEGGNPLANRAARIIQKLVS